MEQYLTPTYFIDCDAPPIVEKAKELVKGASNACEQSQRLFYYVRDSIKYNPYVFAPDIDDFKASAVLEKGEGFCVQKATILAALARAVDIPTRLIFADIKNHQTPDKLKSALGTNIFAYHGYDELYLDGKWVKAAPIFHLQMCQENDIIPVEFDGTKDAVLHSYDLKGRLHIEYLREHGSFADIPLDKIMHTFAEVYSFISDKAQKIADDFHIQTEQANCQT